MKFLTAIILTALLGYAAALYFPWWSFAVASFIVALTIHQKGVKAFFAGFLGIFLLWGIHAFIIDSANEHILSKKISVLLSLGGSFILLIFVTAFIGGLIAAFAALTGSLARRSIRK